LQKKKILVVRDRKHSLNLCKKLPGESYGVISAESGRDGIKAAIHESPELILVELNDNVGKGISLCGEFTRRDGTWKIPAVVICNSSHAGVVDRAGCSGVVDYILRPISPALLLKLIQTTLERHSGNLIRCRKCLKPMRTGWAFCPYDGTKLPESGCG